MEDRLVVIYLANHLINQFWSLIKEKKEMLRLITFLPKMQIARRYSGASLKINQDKN